MYQIKNDKVFNKFILLNSFSKSSSIEGLFDDSGSSVDILRNIGGTSANGVSHFGLKMVDVNGNVVKGDIEYNEYLLLNGSSISGDSDTVKMKAKSFLQTLKEQYKSIASKATTGYQINNSKTGILEKINFDEIYNQSIQNVIDSLNINSSKNVDIMLNVDYLVKNFGNILEMNIEKAVQNLQETSNSDFCSQSEFAAQQAAAKTFSGRTADGECKFGLKMSGRNGKKPSGKIDYKDYIQENGSNIRGSVNTVKTKVKELLNQLKPQFRAIANQAAANVITMIGAPTPSLLEKIDFDGIYEKSVEDVLKLITVQNINIDSLVKKFSTILEINLEQAKCGGYFSANYDVKGK